jgi:hypothetical protein
MAVLGTGNQARVHGILRSTWRTCTDQDGILEQRYARQLRSHNKGSLTVLSQPIGGTAATTAPWSPASRHQTAVPALGGTIPLPLM